MAVYHARAKVFTDLSKEEGDYDEPDDIICEGTEGLTERECLGEDCCSDRQESPGADRQRLQY